MGIGIELIPDRDEALSIHAAQGSNGRIINHCLTVARIAQVLVKRFEEKGIAVDGKSVIAAALLHDIGRNKTQGADHGFVGSQVVKEYGVDESVSTIIRRHVGAGITREEAMALGLPLEYDYVPTTLEDKIVCFADKLVGPGGELVPLAREVEKFKKKGLDYHRLEKLKESLREALGGGGEEDDPEVVVRRKLG